MFQKIFYIVAALAVVPFLWTAILVLVWRIALRRARAKADAQARAVQTQARTDKQPKGRPHQIIDVTADVVGVLPLTNDGQFADFILDGVATVADPLSVRGLLIRDSLSHSRPLPARAIIVLHQPEASPFETKDGVRDTSVRVVFDPETSRIYANVAMGPTGKAWEKLYAKHGSRNQDDIPDAEIQAECLAFSYLLPCHELIHQAIHVGLGEQCEGWEKFKVAKPI
jgi:hypothetical protein